MRISDWSSDVCSSDLYDAPAEVRQRMLPGLSRIVSHVAVQTIEPQTLSYAMHDSPVGMLAWLAQRRREWGQTKDGDIESAFPREHILTTATLYWATECFASAARFYREAVLHPWVPSHDRTPRIEAPTGITLLGGENLPGMTTEDRVQAFVKGPAAQNYNLHFLNTHPTGGHFAHYENPDACIAHIQNTQINSSH